MALNHYIQTSASSEGDRTITVGGSTYQVFDIQEVDTGYELAVVTTRITGGATGGEVHLLTYRGNSVAADVPFTIGPGEVIYINSKEFYEAGDTLSMYATEVGVTVEVFADYSEA